VTIGGMYSAYNLVSGYLFTFLSISSYKIMIFSDFGKHFIKYHSALFHQKDNKLVKKTANYVIK